MPASQWQWRNPIHPCSGKRGDIWVTTWEKCCICFWIGWENIYTFITTSKPSSAGSCCGALGPAGTARLCQAFPFPPELHGESPWSELIPKPCWGTNYLRSHWRVWAKTREGFFYLFTITDAEFLHLCPSVVNLLVSTMANEKEVYASQGVEFLNIAGVQDQKYLCFLSG